MRGRRIIILLVAAAVVIGCGIVSPRNMFDASEVDERFLVRDSLPGAPAASVADPTDFSFFLVADTHYDDMPLSVYRALAELAPSYDASFVLTLGDITQAGTTEQFALLAEDLKALDTAGVTHYPVLGNHDLISEDFGPFSRTGPSMYDFLIGDTLFIILDTASSTLGALQADWYENLLRSTSAGNILVFTHNSLVYGPRIEATVMSYPEEVYYLLDLHSRTGVDALFTGHQHLFRRVDIGGVFYWTVSNAASWDMNVFAVRVTGDQISVSPLSVEFP